MSSIKGIGTDIVSLDRIETLWEKFGERFAKKILSPDEFKQLLKKSSPVSYLAGRFAAKEALSKAIGTGLQKPVWLTDISILNDLQGKPLIQFSEQACDYLHAMGLSTFHLSLSHEKHYAVAFVLATD